MIETSVMKKWKRTVTIENLHEVTIMLRFWGKLWSWSRRSCEMGKMSISSIWVFFHKHSGFTGPQGGYLFNSSLPIFFLPREFKEKNKNTSNDNENSLADLRISQEKKFPFLDLHVTENFLQNLWCFFYSQSIVYHAISLASEQHFHSDLQLQRKFIGNFSIGYYSEPKCIILCSCSYRVLFCDTELAFV